MVEYSVLGNRTALAVLHRLWLCKQGQTGRGLASLVQLSPQSVHNTLRLLEHHFLVEVQTVGKAKLYQLNRKHFFLAEGLIPLWQKCSAWLEALGAFYQRRLDPSPLSIILYGSYARGTQKANSDVDLLLIYPNKISADQLDSVLRWNSMVQRTFGVLPSLKLIVLTDFKKTVRNKEGFLRNIFREGKVLAGKEMSEL